jgi:DNA-binding CsgD family transcriptional regulator
MDSASREAIRRPLELGRLSPAEKRVLDHLLAGRSAREIAELLVLSQATVRSHLSRIYAKLDVSGQVELLARASSPGGAWDHAQEPPLPRIAGPGPTPRSDPVAPSRGPLTLLLIGLAALSVIPPLAVVIGPGLLIGSWLAGRAADGTALRSMRPWILVVGVIVTIWAALILLAVVGLMSVGTGVEPTS